MTECILFECRRRIQGKEQSREEFVCELPHARRQKTALRREKKKLWALTGGALKFHADKKQKRLHRQHLLQAIDSFEVGGTIE